MSVELVHVIRPICRPVAFRVNHSSRPICSKSSCRVALAVDIRLDSSDAELAFLVDNFGQVATVGFTTEHQKRARTLWIHGQCLDPSVPRSVFDLLGGEVFTYRSTSSIGINGSTSSSASEMLVVAKAPARQLLCDAELFV